MDIPCDGSENCPCEDCYWANREANELEAALSLQEMDLASDMGDRGNYLDLVADEDDLPREDPWQNVLDEDDEVGHDMARQLRQQEREMEIIANSRGVEVEDLDGYFRQGVWVDIGPPRRRGTMGRPHQDRIDGQPFRRLPGQD